MNKIQCYRCKKYKSSLDYSKSKYKTNGLQTYCRECNRELQRIAYKKNPTPMKEYSQAYRDNGYRPPAKDTNNG